jgi:hypothetical protein
LTEAQTLANEKNKEAMEAPTPLNIISKIVSPVLKKEPETPRSGSGPGHILPTLVNVNANTSKSNVGAKGECH